MKQKDLSSVQDWLPFEDILDYGIVKLKNNNYIKIIKVIPINFNLKSDLEKEAILNSYKLFLKTCNFDFQILIQSNKIDLSKNISNLKEKIKKEKNNLIFQISKKYIDFIQNLNLQKKSSSKNFFIIIKYFNKNTNQDNLYKIAEEELNEKYLKIRECLSRCGNTVEELSKKETLEIIYSFLNTRMYLNYK